MSLALLRSSATARSEVTNEMSFDHPTHWGTERSTPDFESNIIKLLAAFRTKQNPIIHVCHHSLSPSSPLHPSNPGAAFTDYALPQGDEPVISKSVNSGFIGTDLSDRIKSLGIESLVIVGLTTGHCVSTTTRMAANLNVVGGENNVVLVSDATAMFNREFEGMMYDAETLHRINLATINEEFCVVKRTEEVLIEL
ncbi:isochorismatase hydrolase [Xylariaceae sp. FL1272]|nr:isochorismatase hydrolase [Xylariaceae sp. FL1272]